MCTKDEASSHTVYLALKKEKENNLKDSSHRPKRKHPNHLPEEIENIIIHYRKKTGFGKRRLSYHIYDKEKIYIPESTIGKVLKRRNLVRKKRRIKRKRTKRYNWDALYPFQFLQVDVKEILDSGTLPSHIYKHLERSDLPIYQWTAIDVLTRIRFIAYSYKKDWLCGKAFCQMIIWWIRSFGFSHHITIQKM